MSIFDFFGCTYVHICKVYFDLVPNASIKLILLFKVVTSQPTLVFVYAAMCSSWQTLVQQGSWPQERRSSPSMVQRSTSTPGCTREPSLTHRRRKTSPPRSAVVLSYLHVEVPRHLAILRLRCAFLESRNCVSILRLRKYIA